MSNRPDIHPLLSPFLKGHKISSTLRTALRDSVLVPTQEAPVIQPRSGAMGALLQHLLFLGKQRRVPTQHLLPAIFDLLVGLVYTENIFENGVNRGHITAHMCTKHSLNTIPSPALFIPFVNACPSCLAQGAVEHAAAQKPQSATIGDVSAQVLAYMLDYLFSCADVSGRFFVATQTSAAVDAVIGFDQGIILAEIKASPLVTLPLLVASPTAQYPTNQRHASLPLPISGVGHVSLFLPSGSAVSISSGGPSFTKPGWAFRGLLYTLENHPGAFNEFLSAWVDLYVLSAEIPRTRPTRFFFSNGSGVRNGVKVSDSKNLPGFDRTDDIKKAVYQLIAFSVHYSDGPSDAAILHNVVLSNLRPLRHFESYLKDFLHVVVAKSDVSQREIPRPLWRYIFDGMVALDWQFYNDKHLDGLFTKPLACPESERG